MLRQLIEILEKISKGIEEGIESPCELRTRLEARGLEVSAWTVLNTRQQHCYSRFFNHQELMAGDDKLIVQYVYEACRFFKTKRTAPGKPAPANETLKLFDDFDGKTA